jgi:hypothetical protein
MRLAIASAVAIAIAIGLRPEIASADLANNEALHDHVDALARTRVGVMGEVREALFADRLTLSLGALIPIFGTYRLDEKVFGSVRPSAIVFDWVLGGAAPLVLGVVALEGGALSPHTRAIVGWTAVGLYAATRIGVLIIGNLHVTEFNRYLGLRLGVAAVPGAGLVLATTSW